MSDDKEVSYSQVVRTILGSAIALTDNPWIAWYLTAVNRTSDITDKIRLDIAFGEKVHAMRLSKVITADAATVRAKAEEIVDNNPEGDWFGLATQYGHTIVSAPVE